MSIRYGRDSSIRYSDSLRTGRSGDRNPVRAKFFPPVQTGAGIHPASYTMGTGFFPGVKRPRRGADHSRHLASRLREYSFTSTSPLGLQGRLQGELSLLRLMKDYAHKEWEVYWWMTNRRTLNEASHGLMCGAVPGFPLGDWVRRQESPVHDSQPSGRHCRQSLTNHNAVLPTWLRCSQNWR